MTAPAALTSEQVEELAKLLPETTTLATLLIIEGDFGTIEFDKANYLAFEQLWENRHALAETARAYHRLTSQMEYLASKGVSMSYDNEKVRLDPLRIGEAAWLLGWKDPQ